MENHKTKLYKEEIDFIFGKKAFCVRGALVISAFIEGQILLLAKSFLKEHKVSLTIKEYLEYKLSLNILEANEILDKKEVEKVRYFWEERNKAIHGIFKAMTRLEWEKQNNKVVTLGRPIVKNLDKKLYYKA